MKNSLAFPRNLQKNVSCLFASQFPIWWSTTEFLMIISSFTTSIHQILSKNIPDLENSSIFIQRLFLAIFHARQTNVRQQCAVPHQLSPRRAVMNETGVVFCQFEINGTTITLQAHITHKKGQCEQMEVKTFKLGSNDLCITSATYLFAVYL